MKEKEKSRQVKKVIPTTNHLYSVLHHPRRISVPWCRLMLMMATMNSNGEEMEKRKRRLEDQEAAGGTAAEDAHPNKKLQFSSDSHLATHSHPHPNVNGYSSMPPPPDPQPEEDQSPYKGLEVSILDLYLPSSFLFPFFSLNLISSLSFQY